MRRLELFRRVVLLRALLFRPVLLRVALLRPVDVRRRDWSDELQLEKFKIGRDLYWKPFVAHLFGFQQGPILALLCHFQRRRW